MRNFCVLVFGVTILAWLKLPTVYPEMLSLHNLVSLATPVVIALGVYAFSRDSHLRFWMAMMIVITLCSVWLFVNYLSGYTVVLFLLVTMTIVSIGAFLSENTIAALPKQLERWFAGEVPSHEQLGMIPVQTASVPEFIGLDIMNRDFDPSA